MRLGRPRVPIQVDILITVIFLASVGLTAGIAMKKTPFIVIFSISLAIAVVFLPIFIIKIIRNSDSESHDETTPGFYLKRKYDKVFKSIIGERYKLKKRKELSDTFNTLGLGTYSDDFFSSILYGVFSTGGALLLLVELNGTDTFLGKKQSQRLCEIFAEAGVTLVNIYSAGGPDAIYIRKVLGRHIKIDGYPNSW